MVKNRHLAGPPPSNPACRAAARRRRVKPSLPRRQAKAGQTRKSNRFPIPIVGTSSRGYHHILWFPWHNAQSMAVGGHHSGRRCRQQFRNPQWEAGLRPIRNWSRTQSHSVKPQPGVASALCADFAQLRVKPSQTQAALPRRPDLGPSSSFAPPDYSAIPEIAHFGQDLPNRPAE